MRPSNCLDNTSPKDKSPKADAKPTQAQVIAAIKRQEGSVAVEPVLRVSLRGSRITDALLVRVKELTNLQELHLTQSKVTDAGLKHLKVLTKLQVLHLRNTKVTDAGVKKLQAALPKCKIVR